MKKTYMTPQTEVLELEADGLMNTISAGIGDRVIVSTGSSARRMLGNDAVPCDAAVVGIIDEDCELK